MYKSKHKCRDLTWKYNPTQPNENCQISISDHLKNLAKYPNNLKEITYLEDKLDEVLDVPLEGLDEAEIKILYKLTIYKKNKDGGFKLIFIENKHLKMF